MVKLALRKGTVKMDSEILSFGRMMRHESFWLPNSMACRLIYETSYLFSNPTVSGKPRIPRIQVKMPSPPGSQIRWINLVHTYCIKTPGHLEPDWVSENTAGVMAPSDSLKYIMQRSGGFPPLVHQFTQPLLKPWQSIWLDYLVSADTNGNLLYIFKYMYISSTMPTSM